jgi:hypothetical protein
MNLRTRIERLEGKMRATQPGPSVILLFDAVSGEPGAAWHRRGLSTRLEGETAEAFADRVAVESVSALSRPSSDAPKGDI